MHKTIREALGRDPVHPFPARMAPGIVFNAIQARRGRPLRVLDPMMGSGTVLAMAQKKGHHAIGFDLDPLAVLISRVWTTKVGEKSLLRAAESVLSAARKNAPKLTYNRAFPVGADLSTRKFIRYWFDAESRRQLTALSAGILRIKNRKIREALLCAFSRLIIAKSSGASLARDLAHSRPHKAYDEAPRQPFESFIFAAKHVAKNCGREDKSDTVLRANARVGDARSLNIESNSIDLALTSPPYLNAIDYIRCSKFTLVWLGYKIDQLTEVRRNSVGAEIGKSIEDVGDNVSKTIRRLKLRRKLDDRHKAILVRFIHDMQKSLLEIARVLSPGGRAIYVVGENNLRGVYIRNSVIIEESAKYAGLRLIKRNSRMLPRSRRYLPPPTRKNAKEMDLRMGREVILTFRKSG